MTKKALDEKYSYQIDEHNVVHLFRGEDDCQQYLTNPLLSAIFKIETLEKENTELKDDNKVMADNYSKMEQKFYENLTKAKELIENLSKSLFLAKGIVRDLIDDTVDFKESKERAIYCYEQEKFDIYKEAEDFLKESE